MIEILTDANWLSPQIDFLVCLQNLRLSHSNIISELFLSITVFGEIWLPTILCAIIYWCIDSKNGAYLFSVFGFNYLFSILLKMLACIYRPWILSDRVQPIDCALNAAKSYSFPSGHSSVASSVYGGLAYVLRKYKIFAILLVVFVLSIGFSRLWLGVHTPQDVVTGLCVGFLLVFLFAYMINWAEQDRNRYLYILVFADIFAVCALVYYCYFNVYPVDYIDGKLLVNPQKAIYVTIILYGYALGLINGIGLCRRFFPFDAKEGSLLSKIIRGLVGAAYIILVMKFGMEYVFKHHLDYKLACFIPFLIGFSITAIYPYILSKVVKSVVKS